MTVAERTTVDVRLESGDSPRPECHELPVSEYQDSFYADPPEPLSIAPLFGSGDLYRAGVSRVARTNARWAHGRGYRWQLVDRSEWEDDLHAIRSSAPWRQGRPMPASYMEWQPYGSDALPEDHCRRHLVAIHGVLSDEERLVAYLQMVQCGEIARINTIIGHADHLPNRVMWLLCLDALSWHANYCRAEFGLYYTHDSGSGGGLRYFKERLGFRACEPRWVP